MNLNYLISNAQDLPNIPEIVQELIESFNSETVDSTQVAKKISKDQAMTAKVLRMANSSKYGGHRQVGSVNDAVVLLGFNALRTMVLASGLTGTFKSPEGFNIKSFWHKSFSVANLCKWLAKYQREIDAEVAFTCGMLHDIGGLLTFILANDTAQEIERVVAKGANRVEMETHRLGFTYAEAGAELANRWKFPQVIVDGIRYQLTPDTEEGYKPLAGMVYLALYLHRYRDQGTDYLVQNFPYDMLESLKLDKVSVIDNLEEIYQLDEGIEELID